MKKVLQKIIYLLSKSKLLYIFSKKIVDYHRNENNCEIKSNGELHFIRENKDKMETIFDVGANIGEWTDLVSNIIPKAKIYSFEPSLQTFTVLQKQNFRPGVSLHNIGLGDKNEVKDFFVNNDDSTLNSAFRRDIGQSNLKDNVSSEKSSFETLDSFCEKNNIDRVSFLKIDTEGNELFVLRGATQYIQSGKIDMIQFEYGGTYVDSKTSLKDVFSFFEDKPYSIFKMMSKGLKRYEAYSNDLENFQYANYVAILK